MNEQNPFGDLGTEGLEASKDFLGGGGTVESGVYPGTIKLAYAGITDNGARFLAVHVDIGGRDHRETLYVTNRNGQNFYEKGGKKIPLPGFTTANDLALLSTGQALGQQTLEEKVVKLYDFDAKEEVPTKVQAVTSMLGKEVTLGLVKQTVDKNVKDASGAYVPSGETRDENVIDKVFHTESGKTVSEFTAKAPEAAFQDAWATKNTGVSRNRAKGASGKTGSPGASTAASAAKTPSKSLFG